MSDKRNMGYTNRQGYFREHWKLTRPPWKNEARGREMGKGRQILFIRLHIILYQCLIEEGSLHSWKMITVLRGPGHCKMRSCVFWDQMWFNDTWCVVQQQCRDALMPELFQASIPSVIKLTVSWMTEKTVRVIAATYCVYIVFNGQHVTRGEKNVALFTTGIAVREKL